MIKNGSIPEKITIASNGKSKPYRNYEDLGNEEEEFFVIPAFAVDSSSEKMVASASEWAKRKGKYYDYETKQYVEINELKIEEKTNEPIKGLKIIGLEHRGNGGRAYKVLTEEGYYFDVREEVLLDTILNEGISKGGVLGGSFVWGKVGSQMKLVRYGSKLYNELSQSGERHSLKKIGLKGLKAGSIYENKSGVKSLFVGWISTTEIRSTRRKTYSYNSVPIFNFSSKIINKAMLFMELSRYNKKEPAEIFSSWLNSESNVYCGFSIKTSHSFVKESGIINMPSNILNIIIDTKIHEAEEYRDRYSSLDYNVNYYSKIINIVPYGNPIKVHPIFNNITITERL